MSGGKCTAAAVAVGGCVPRPVRASWVEKALAGQSLTTETIAKSAGQVSQDLGGDILGDLYTSATSEGRRVSVGQARGDRRSRTDEVSEKGSGVLSLAPNNAMPKKTADPFRLRRSTNFRSFSSDSSMSPTAGSRRPSTWP